MDHFVITIESNNTDYTNDSNQTTLFDSFIQRINHRLSILEETYNKTVREKYDLPLCVTDSHRCLDYDFEMVDLSKNKSYVTLQKKNIPENIIIPMNEDKHQQKQPYNDQVRRHTHNDYTPVTLNNQIISTDLYCDMV